MLVAKVALVARDWMRESGWLLETGGGRGAGCQGALVVMDWRWKRLQESYGC